ncbi:MAG TPA: hypothetical protein VGI74_17495 [Streptosporangiaceae bacterium]
MRHRMWPPGGILCRERRRPVTGRFAVIRGGSMDRRASSLSSQSMIIPVASSGAGIASPGAKSRCHSS